MNAMNNKRATMERGAHSQLPPQAMPLIFYLMPQATGGV
jgi:hypothetical protein